MFKFRKAVKSFVERKENGGMIIKPYHCIETLHNRKWRLVGDENGLRKFEKAEDRDAYLEELRKMAAESNNSNPMGQGLRSNTLDPVVVDRYLTK
jgi:hypothetical protein